MNKKTLWMGAVGGLLISVLGGGARGALPAYSLVGSYPLPVGTQAIDVMPSGRLVAMRGGEILTQDGLDSGAFTAAATLDPTIFDGPFGNFGPSFVALSPDGTKLAIGDNNAKNRVHLLEFASLDTAPAAPTAMTFVDNVPSGEAHWHDNQTLFVAGGAFGQPASVVRITAPTIIAATAQVVVSNINGASGGVTSDGSFLYTANGFEADATGSRTGEVRAIPLADLPGPTGAPVDFEARGIPVAQALSGSSLGFDSLGNLLIGGGDFATGDFGYAGVLDGDAIAAALTGGPMVGIPAQVRLTPASPTDFYNIRHNPVTGELLVTAFGSDVVYRYSIPAPGGGVGIASAGGLLAMMRRRRAE